MDAEFFDHGGDSILDIFGADVKLMATATLLTLKICDFNHVWPAVRSSKSCFLNIKIEEVHKITSTFVF